MTRAANASRTLLSPLDYEDIDAWRIEVARQLKGLLGAEVAAFALPSAGIYSEEFPTPMPEFLEAAVPAYEEFGIRDLMVEMPIMTPTKGMGRRRSEYVRSPFFQEFLKAKHCYESITLAAAPRTGARIDEIPAIHLHKSRDEERFNEKQEALSQLIYPAFKAGVEMVRQMGVQRSGLRHILDGLGEAAMLVDVSGRTLHVNQALSEMGALDPEMTQIEEAMIRVARATGQGGSEVHPAAAISEVHTAAARYRLRVTLLSEEVMGRSPAVLVVTERLSAVLPSGDRLKEHFGLTKQQTRVALLLAKGMTDKEIAEKLFISPHTARNHSKHVLKKLEINSRAQVRPVLERGRAA